MNSVAVGGQQYADNYIAIPKSFPTERREEEEKEK